MLDRTSCGSTSPIELARVNVSSQSVSSGGSDLSGPLRVTKSRKPDGALIIHSITPGKKKSSHKPNTKWERTQTASPAVEENAVGGSTTQDCIRQWATDTVHHIREFVDSVKRDTEALSETLEESHQVELSLFSESQGSPSPSPRCTPSPTGPAFRQRPPLPPRLPQTAVDLEYHMDFPLQSPEIEAHWRDQVVIIANLFARRAQQIGEESRYNRTPIDPALQRTPYGKVEASEASRRRVFYDLERTARGVIHEEIADILQASIDRAHHRVRQAQSRNSHLENAEASEIALELAQHVQRRQDREKLNSAIEAWKQQIAPPSASLPTSPILSSRYSPIADDSMCEVLQMTGPLGSHFDRNIADIRDIAPYPSSIHATSTMTSTMAKPGMEVSVHTFTRHPNLQSQQLLLEEEEVTAHHHILFLEQVERQALLQRFANDIKETGLRHSTSVFPSQDGNEVKQAVAQTTGDLHSLPPIHYSSMDSIRVPQTPPRRAQSAGAWLSPMHRRRSNSPSLPLQKPIGANPEAHCSSVCGTHTTVGISMEAITDKAERSDFVEVIAQSPASPLITFTSPFTPRGESIYGTPCYSGSPFTLPPDTPRGFGPSDGALQFSDHPSRIGLASDSPIADDQQSQIMEDATTTERRSVTTMTKETVILKVNGEEQSRAETPEVYTFSSEFRVLERRASGSEDGMSRTGQPDSTGDKAWQLQRSLTFGRLERDESYARHRIFEDQEEQRHSLSLQSCTQLNALNHKWRLRLRAAFQQCLIDETLQRSHLQHEQRTSWVVLMDRHHRDFVAVARAAKVDVKALNVSMRQGIDDSFASQMSYVWSYSSSTAFPSRPSSPAFSYNRMAELEVEEARTRALIADAQTECFRAIVYTQWAAQKVLRPTQQEEMPTLHQFTSRLMVFEKVHDGAIADLEIEENYIRLRIYREESGEWAKVTFEWTAACTARAQRSPTVLNRIMTSPTLSEERRMKSRLEKTPMSRSMTAGDRTPRRQALDIGSMPLLASRTPGNIVEKKSGVRKGHSRSKVDSLRVSTETSNISESSSADFDGDTASSEPVPRPALAVKRRGSFTDTKLAVHKTHHSEASNSLRAASPQLGRSTSIPLSARLMGAHQGAPVPRHPHSARRPTDEYSVTSTFRPPTSARSNSDKQGSRHASPVLLASSCHTPRRHDHHSSLTTTSKSIEQRTSRRNSESSKLEHPPVTNTPARRGSVQLVRPQGEPVIWSDIPRRAPICATPRTKAPRSPKETSVPMPPASPISDATEGSISVTLMPRGPTFATAIHGEEAVSVHQTTPASPLHAASVTHWASQASQGHQLEDRVVVLDHSIQGEAERVLSNPDTRWVYQLWQWEKEEYYCRCTYVIEEEQQERLALMQRLWQEMPREVPKAAVAEDTRAQSIVSHEEHTVTTSEEVVLPPKAPQTPASSIKKKAQLTPRVSVPQVSLSPEPPQASWCSGQAGAVSVVDASAMVARDLNPYTTQWVQAYRDVTASAAQPTFLSQPYETYQLPTTYTYSVQPVTQPMVESYSIVNPYPTMEATSYPGRSPSPVISVAAYTAPTASTIPPCMSPYALRSYSPSITLDSLPVAQSPICLQPMPMRSMSPSIIQLDTRSSSPYRNIVVGPPIPLPPIVECCQGRHCSTCACSGCAPPLLTRSSTTTTTRTCKQVASNGNGNHKAGATAAILPKR